MSNAREFSIRNGILLRYTGTKTNVVIPDHVKAIGNYAFQDSRRVTSVTIPEGVVSIGEHAFEFCSNLSAVHIPDSVTYIGQAAFMWCKNLTQLVLPRGLTHICKDTFWACYSLTRMDIPEGVTAIGESAFAYCEGLISVTIPGSVRSIENQAFLACTELTDLIMEPGPEALKMDFQSVFDGCRNIEAILAPGIPPENMNPPCKLAAAVGYLVCSEQFRDPDIAAAYRNYIRRQKKRILAALFEMDLVAELEKLTQITGITVSNFDAMFLKPAMEAEAHECVAFLMDWKRQHISPEMLERQLQRELMKDPFHAADMKKLWSFKKLPDGSLSITGYKGDETDIGIPPRIGNTPVTAIDASAFDAEKSRKAKKQPQLQSVFIPDGVTSIGYHAFYKCEKLAQVTIAASVKSIGSSAFLGCKSLTGVVIPSGVTSIGECAFFGCDSLKDVTVPSNVTFIGKSAFSRTVTLHAAKGSYALSYAKINRIPFAVL